MKLFVQHRVIGDVVHELVFLIHARQLAVKQQVAHFHEVAVLGQLLDRIPAIKQYPGIAVDVRDLGLAAASRCKSGVEGEMSGIGVETPDIHDFRSLGAGNQGHGD